MAALGSDGTRGPLVTAPRPHAVARPVGSLLTHAFAAIGDLHPATLPRFEDKGAKGSLPVQALAGTAPGRLVRIA